MYRLCFPIQETSERLKASWLNNCDVPCFNRIKEWIYAGLLLDVVGATYSALAPLASIHKCW